MRCSTVQSTVGPGDEPCQGTATHLLISSIRTDEESREPFRDPVCKPCGESYVRRPALKARLVPLHVHMTDNMFIETVEGHRLIKDPEYEARCFDCGTTGTPNWFRFQTNGCAGRPESVTALHYSREFLRSSRDMVEESARLWWDYAVNYLHMKVEDWRLVTDHAMYSAYFTFRDREYGVRHDLPGGRFGAEKRENRGRPLPEIISPELQDRYKQVVFRFYDLINKYEGAYFAAYTPGREDVILYTPEGAIRAVLRFPDLEGTREGRLAVVTDAVCDTFGAITQLQYQTRIYGETG